MPEQQQQPQSAFTSLAEGVGLAYAAARCAAALVFPVVRVGYGAEALGAPGLAAFAALLLCGTVDPVVAAYFWFWLPAVLAQRLCGWARDRRGPALHSRDGGRSWTVDWLPGVRDAAAARRLESVPLILAGLLLLGASPASERLGALVLAGAFGNAVVTGMDQEAARRRRRRLMDARIEAESLARTARGEEGRF